MSTTTVVSVLRRLGDPDDSFWDRRPRWQTVAVTAIVGWVASWSLLSSEATARFEFLVATLLGQPLSRRAWDRMTFNDKVTYRRLRVHDPRLTVFADKMRMREYVVDRLGPHSVPRLIRSGDNAEAFSDLLGPFALKATHGSGWVIIVDGARVLTEEEKVRAQSWLSVNFGDVKREWAYHAARPLLSAEELVGPPPLREFRLFVFDGQVALVQVDTGRFARRERALFSPEWSYLGELIYPAPTPLPMRPTTMDTMLQWAAILAEDIDFVRVDMYDLGDRVLVGELTPYPGAGMARFRPAVVDRWLGQRWTTRPRHSAR